MRGPADIFFGRILADFTWCLGIVLLLFQRKKRPELPGRTLWKSSLTNFLAAGNEVGVGGRGGVRPLEFVRLRESNLKPGEGDG